MADVKGPVFNPVDDLKALLLFVVALWLLWFNTGGPARYEEARKPFRGPPVVAKDNNIWRDPYPGEQYGSIPAVEIKVKVEKPKGLAEGANSIKKYSLYSDSIAYLTKGPADSTGKSYIKFDYLVFNKTPLNITGLLVKDLFGKTAVIPGASYLPYQGKVNPEADVLALPGSTIFIIEGQSPIGVSFRVNKCIGLLSQFQSFYPALPPLSLDLVQSQDGQAPLEFALTYNDCVDAHQGDVDFYTNDWRVYLGNKNKIWGETSDLVKIVDDSGQTLTSVFY